MTFVELLTKRRSIRKYKEKPIEEPKIAQLIEAALRSPSSRNNRPWEFIFVQDRDLLQKLSTAKQSGSAFVADAPLVVVVCGDREKSDVWIEDASIAATMLFLEAESLDLGACWVQIRKRPHDDSADAEGYVCKLLGLPERFGVLCLVAIGEPDESLDAHPKKSLLYERVHDARFGSPYNKS